tara:strand:+ start:235 stop:483 length:249 start_codon:yes stop_codon:yes gene_type:complete
MANEIVISKITPQTIQNYIVDWIYGTDSNSRGVSTAVNLSSLPVADRQSNEKVKEFLKTHLDESIFKNLDDDIAANSAIKND